MSGENSVFVVVGGEDELRRELDSIEFYDTKQNEWIFGLPMQVMA